MANPSRKIIEAVQKSPLIRIPLKPTFPNGYVPADHTFCTPSFRNPLIRTYSSSPSPVDFSNSRSLTWLRFYETISKQKSPSGGFSQSLSQKHHFHTSFGNSHSNGVFPSVFSNSGHLISSASKLPTVFSQRLAFHKLGGFPLGCRYFSSKRPNFSQFNGSFMKSVAGKPLSSIRSAFLRYREAVGLQIEAFWRRNYMVLLGIGGFALCIGLWRFMFGIANTFVGFSEGMAKYGFLALSASIVAFAGLYVRSRFTINPDKVYRIAMRKLNTSAGILEVMGAPLSGTDLRAYVMSAGGLKLKNFKPTIGSKRCFLIFPIHGSERKGLVSVEVKKKKGQYDMKLLAVDIPMASGPDQRFFLIGDENEYQVGGGLISELRDPIIKAMAAIKEFEALDEKEEEEDANRELEEAERKNREEIAKLEKDREEIVKLEKDNMQ